MANSLDSDLSIELDHRTCVAVCDGIGDRLKDTLQPTVAAPLPDFLQRLVDRLKEIDEAPSIVPAQRPPQLRKAV
ncbi:MAG: hypothetical protein K2W78_00065 [Xanthobacteraceae bacterium]|nr:hypothetical protein [Xanthobacteraceae bacterium]